MTPEDEIVVYPDPTNLSPEEEARLLRENETAKELHSRRREERWLNEPSLVEKFKNGIKKMFAAKQKTAEVQNVPTGKER